METVALLNTALTGRYEIEREIGTGGMATVYLARDLKHDRLVALKLLRPDLSAVIGAERFLHEIRVAAHLQHPHLLPLFDSGEADGLLFYVMPFVEGESLRARITRERQMGIEDAVRITIQVAAALDYAHRRGVVHRDVKPENILLHDGQAMIADFGIALAVSNAGGTRITETGISLGTPYYMSPEQASADRDLDGRTDIYALGAVLYEMLAGAPPHTGPSAQAVMAKLMTEEVKSLTEARRTVPVHVDMAVRRALSKLPADRWGSAAEFATALERGVVAPVTTSWPIARPRWNHWTAYLPWSVALLSIAIAIVTTVRQGSSPRQVARLSFTPPEKQSLGTIAISPDGRQFAFTAADSTGRVLLWVQPIDAVTARPLRDTDGASYPFWSPDSRSIAFFSGDSLKKVDAAGSVQTLCALPREGPRGGSWGTGGDILFAVWGLHPGPLYRVSDQGGAPVPITTLEASGEQHHHWWPTLLPDGQHFLYFALAGDSTGIYLGAHESGGARRVIQTRAAAVYLSRPITASEGTDIILFVRDDGTLMAQSFDRGRWDIVGDPFPVGDRPGVDGLTHRLRLSASQTGTLVYQEGQGVSQLQWFDRQGNELGKAGTPGVHIDLAISADGRRIALQRENLLGRTDIFMIEGARPPYQFTYDTSYHAAPVWSSHDGVLSFFVVRNRWQIWQKATSGTGRERLLYAGTRDLVPADWSPDGTTLLYVDIEPSTGVADVFALMNARDSARRVPIPVATSGAYENFAAFSPDGKWVAYGSDQSGHSEIYVRAFPPDDPGKGGKPISSGGGTRTRWPRGGNEIFYVAPDNRLMAVPVKLTPTFEAGPPVPLFRTWDLGARSFDVTPDGKRFLVSTPVDNAASNRATVVLDWFGEIHTRKVP